MCTKCESTYTRDTQTQTHRLRFHKYGKNKIMPIITLSVRTKHRNLYDVVYTKHMQERKQCVLNAEGVHKRCTDTLIKVPEAQYKQDICLL